MSRWLLRWGLAGALAIACGIASFAQASTIDTFDFTQTMWLIWPSTNTLDSNGFLSGSFTGTVEPGNVINLGDLTSFNAVYSDQTYPGGAFFWDLGKLSLFSFTTTGGPSSLGIVGYSAGGLCVGAPVTLSNSCAPAGFTSPYPSSAFGAIFVADLPELYTTLQPSVTLVSSITPPPPAVPEPPSLLLLLPGLVALGPHLYRRRQAGYRARECLGV